MLSLSRPSIRRHYLGWKIKAQQHWLSHGFDIRKIEPLSISWPSAHRRRFRSRKKKIGLCSSPTYIHTLDYWHFRSYGWSHTVSCVNGDGACIKHHAWPDTEASFWQRSKLASAHSLVLASLYCCMSRRRDDRSSPFLNSRNGALNPVKERKKARKQPSAARSTY